MIVVLGDSWAKGTWRQIDNNLHEISGPGFAEYFKPARVINISQGGSSNSQQLARFDQLAELVPFQSHDEFYWVVTNPIRCIMSAWREEEQLKPWINNISSTVDQAITQVLLDFLTDLNNRAGQQDVSINLIGGLCDLTQVDFTPYSNLTAIVPSWVQLLDAEHTGSIYTTEHMVKISAVIQQDRPELLDEWLDIVEQAQSKDRLFDQLANNRLFECYHPNELAHQLLMTKLTV